jgi:MFS family permease
MPDDIASPPARPLSPFLPLKRPVFRMLWGVWLTANICMWMNDVAAAWLMTSLTASPLYIALVQTASTLPAFLLGLPSGAFADIFDRRRYLIVTQLWVAVVSVIATVAFSTGLMNPWLLLVLTFANGAGLAMRWPVFAAIVPTLVPRIELPLALALNGIAMNTSRIVGPLVAGALIAAAGSPYVFALNAILSVTCAFLLMRWRSEASPSALGPERFLSAMRVGVQFVLQSAQFKTVLLRVSLFFFCSTALLSLLPLVARGLKGDAGTFTILLMSMGSGAILAAVLLPRLRQRHTRDGMVVGGAVLHAISTVALAFATNIYVASAALFLAGMAWVTTANTLNVSAQLALPDWVRARGMSVFQMAYMGSSALGAAVWGQIATFQNVQFSLAVAALAGAGAMIAARRLVSSRAMDEDLTPSHELKAPVFDVSSRRANVLTTIEYVIDPCGSADFQEIMLESRRSRLRQGALRWELFQDVSDPCRYVEQFVDESWTEHLRRFDRLTTSDVALRERKHALHVGESPPTVRRYLLTR